MNKKQSNPKISTAPIRVPDIEQIVAAGDPYVRAVTRNMPVDRQKAVWRRYALIVLRHHNYGRPNRVAGEYVRTRMRED
jgi:hypothetical protein